MAWENELRTYLNKWLLENFASRAEALSFGKLDTISEYKEECAYIRALRDVQGEIENWSKQNHK